MKRKKLFAMGMIMVCILSGCGNNGGGSANGSTEGMAEENIPISIEDGTDSPEESVQGSIAEPEKPEESTEEPAGGAAEPEGPAEEWIALSDDERLLFTEFIQERENYGFLLSDYAVPGDINLSEVLYSGAGFGEQLPEEDTPLYLEAVQQEFVETDCLKFTRQSIEEFLHRKLGIGMEDLNMPFEWMYLSETDSYYHEAGDTNYARFSCVEGKVQGDTYTLHFAPEADWEWYYGDCETVIVKAEDGYRFISNRTLTE